MSKPNTLDLVGVIDALDRAANLMGNPLSTDARARIFAALEDPQAGWQAARSVILRPHSIRHATLWQAVIQTAGDPRLELALAVPTQQQIVDAPQWATR